MHRVLPALLVLLTFAPPAAAQSVPAGVQEYFLIGHPEQLYEILEDIVTGAGNDGMNATTTLTATTDIQTVIYDHWEDGYDPDPFDVGIGKQASTLILGDANDANGNSCNFATRACTTPTPVNADDFIFLDEALSWKSRADNAPPGVVTDYIPYPRDPAGANDWTGDLRYDAPDRIIVVGGPVNLVHAEDPRNRYIGGAMGILPRQLLTDDTRYVVPMGEDLFRQANPNASGPHPYVPFQYTYLMLQSYEDNVNVTVDNSASAFVPDRPGAVGVRSVSFQLSTGDTWSSLGKINLTDAPASAIQILAGTTVRADGPVTALVVTGADGTYQSRSFSLLPESLFTNDYVIPVHGDDPNTSVGGGNDSAPQNIYIYNPDPINDLTVRVYDVDHDDSGNNQMVVGPLQIMAYTEWEPDGPYDPVPSLSTVRLVADRHFWGVSAMDYADTGHDWGYSFVPTSLLTDFVAMSWGPGNRFDPPSSDTENGSPVWISPLMDDTEIRVDYEPDGTFDATFNVDTLSALRLLDPSGDNDQTGMRIWGSNRFVAAFGQDPDTGIYDGDVLDLGYEIMPQDSRFLDELLTIEAISSDYVIGQSGATVDVTLYLRTNLSGTALDVSDLKATFSFPGTWTYVNNSTTVTFPGGAMTTENPTPHPTEPDVLVWDWVGEVTMTGTEVTIVTFQMTIGGGSATNGRYDFEATGSAIYRNRPYNPRDDLTIVKSPYDLSLAVDATSARPGDSLVYTATIVNDDVNPVNGVEVRIPAPFDTNWSDLHGGVYDGGCRCVIHTVDLAASDGVAGSGPDQAVVQLTVDISNDAAVGGSITNQARADTGTPPELISPPVTVDIDAPVLRAELRGPSAAGVGCPFTYDLRVENIGSDVATNTQIDMVVPTFTTYVADSMELFIGNMTDGFTQLTCTDSGADACSLTTGPDTVHALVAQPLAVGSMLVFRYGVDVTGSAGDTIDASFTTRATELPDPVTPFLVVSNTVSTPIDGAFASGDSDSDGLDNGNCTGPCGAPDSEACIGTDPYDADSDDDGINDGHEYLATSGPLFDNGYGPTDPLDFDSDTDGLPDGLEAGVFTALPDTDITAGSFASDTDVGATTTDPNSNDTDLGGILDGVEDANQNGRVDLGEIDPNVWGDDDGDGDGLDNATEDFITPNQLVDAGETDPFDGDSDDDGVLDGAELNWNGQSDTDGTINALDFDSDDDGLSDGLEMGIGVGDPGPDTDLGVFVPDTDPSTTTSMILVDTDGDTLWDSTEDADGDGAVDATETDPNLPDTDNDGSNDNLDCEPLDDQIFPLQTEIVADGIDQNCDGVDACYQDLDDDGFGTSIVVNDNNLNCADTSAVATSAVSGDCDDGSPGTFPGAAPNDSVTDCMRDRDDDDWGDITAISPVIPGTDCNDNPVGGGTVYPTATEIPDDGIDQDCNNYDTVTCFVDGDQDGQGTDVGTTVLADDGSCDTGQQESATDTDCDDSDSDAYLGATEVVDDGIDQDCNGTDTITCYVDFDMDGQGTDVGTTVLATDGACEAAEQESLTNTDCDDTVPSIYQGAIEVLDDGIDQDCNGFDTITCFVDFDQDGDGTDAGTTVAAADGSCDRLESESGTATDCDDIDPTTYFNAPELCDGIDNDCDTAVPAGEVDSDSDAYVACDPWAGTPGLFIGGDCDEGNPDVNPGESEIECNSINDDCDAATLDDPNSDDNDFDGFSVDCGNDCDDTNFFINTSAAENCSDGLDNNCDGLTDDEDVVSCPPTCTTDADSDGFLDPACDSPDPDCDDDNPNINPNEAENCDDGIDNNCDGFTDSADAQCPGGCADGDSDGYPDRTCGGSDCDDVRGDINPGEIEICNDSIDNDCDGLVDGLDLVQCPPGCDDLDDDGYPDVGCGGTDCDDTNQTINPGAGEDCFDGIDNNCDNDVDGDDILCPEGCADADSDAYFDDACNGSDCDDTDPTIHPGVAEDCTDTIDNDCDALVDEDDFVDCPPGCADADSDGYYDRDCGGSDCDDSQFFVNPSLSEVCNNSIDDDCDGLIDFNDAADCPSDCFDADADSDGHLSKACGGNDCDDTNPNINPNAAEDCFDGIDNDCDDHADGDDLADCPFGCADDDSDGFADLSCGGTDCNDGSAAVNPAVAEVDCDGTDNDCNGLTPDLPDHDTDSYVAASCPPGQDCDDGNPLTNPGAGESCEDTIDNNCDGLIDGDDPFCNPGCPDADSDGHRDSSCGGSDCDDSDPNRHPGAGEHCRDGLDNDCDDLVDDADAVDCPPGCLDLDGDGYRAAFCGGTDCEDLRFDINPGAGEQCDDGVDNDCNGLIDEADSACDDVCPDADNDGYDDAACGGADCDDTEASTHPAAGENCGDGVDNNCDTRVDGDDPFCPPGCPDVDSDGYADLACGGSDCDDGDPDVHPGGWEICGDGIDNNCNGLADTADADCPVGCIDADNDGFADAACGGRDCDDLVLAINPAAVEVFCNGIDDDCAAASLDDPDPTDADGDGYTAGCGNDCDESNPYINEGASERCDDGVDNDCDATTDLQDSDCPAGCADEDGDGYFDVACGGTDCDDTSYLTNPGAGEHCTDEVDNNCDGLVDGADAACDTACADADGDGYTDADCGGTDCDDTDPTAHPGGGEHCTDGIDNNCNGFVDELDVGDCPSMCVDADGDGYTDRECGGSDCDDSLVESYPGAPEVCDGGDNDCDGRNDEGYPNLDGDDLADCVDPDGDGDGWDDDVMLSGGGCYCGQLAGGAWAVVGLLLLRRNRRRRRQGREGV